jgi:peptidyl-prolyl cis-trans isomerase B (cyclophilin B)
LLPEKAPSTVKNFLSYVNAGFYDGTIFHRVIKGFMIQGGGFTPDMQIKSTQAPIKNEADNGLKNKRGTVAMARTSQPDSATSQFFINTVDYHFLDFRNKTSAGWGYCVFGKVVDGMDAVDAIEKLATGKKGMHRDVPTEPAIITKAAVIRPTMDAETTP